MKQQEQVKEFMIQARQVVNETPVLLPKQLADFRMRLIEEEFTELKEALDGEDLVEAYDAILDLMYVTVGLAVSMGLKLEMGFDEVHRSNMSKFIDGLVREDGKIIKGPSFSPPDLRSVLKLMQGSQLKSDKNAPYKSIHTV